MALHGQDAPAESLGFPGDGLPQVVAGHGRSLSSEIPARGAKRGTTEAVRKRPALPICFVLISTWECATAIALHSLHSLMRPLPGILTRNSRRVGNRLGVLPSPFGRSLIPENTGEPA
jgi:hypothetical protein